MGNKIRRRWFAMAVVGMLCVVCLSWGEEGSARNPQFVVSVYDDAGVAPEIVLRAEAQASRVFRDAGIDVRWRNSLWGQTTELMPMAAPANCARLNVRILPHSRDLAGEIFGVAFLGEDGHGQQADIFYGGIAKLSARGTHDTGVLLGSVMAHELGHLLLGSHSHSSAGIMRGRWDDTELKLTLAGLQGFNAEQAMRMRERIAGFAKSDAPVVSASRVQERNRVEEPWIARLR
jgi:hypothetical protein